MREFLSTLRQNNIRLKLVDGELSVKYPKGTANKELLDGIRSNKAALIDYLTLISQYDHLDIPLAADTTEYPLSSAQRRLWILSQSEEGNSAYNIPAAYLFEGDLDTEALRSAFMQVVARHEILRTVFRESRGEAHQLIRPANESGFHLAVHDLRETADPETVAQAGVAAIANQVFDLANGPLLRAELFRLPANRWILAYAMHHIVSDGWSVDLLMQELLLLYKSLSNGEAHMLSPLRIQYKDYAAWEQQQLRGNAFEAHKNYWLDQFAGELPVLELVADHARPAIKTYNGAVATASVDAALTTALKTLGREEGGTLFMTLVAAVNTLLYRYTGQEDIVIGSPIAGREHADLEEQIGFYINTLALRSRFSGTDSFKDLLEEVKKVTLSAYKYQAYPFDELVDALQLRRDRSRHPLFDVTVVLQNAGMQQANAARSFDGLKVDWYETAGDVSSKFDLGFDFSESGDSLQINLAYNTDIYDGATAQRLLRHLVQLLRAVTAQPEVALNRIAYMDKAGQEQVLRTFNDTASYPVHEPVVSLLDAQAARTPDRVALVSQAGSLTYAQLHQRVDNLAAYLKTEQGIGVGDKVAIMMEHSELLVIAILGVLKSGAAYVPIDIDHPTARKQFILDDTQAKVLITQSDYLFELDYYTGSLFAIDIQLEGLDAAAPQPAVSKPADLAYIIYTSGSTGRPKGVMISHRSLSHYLVYTQQSLTFDCVSGSFMHQSFTFDASLTALFLPLMAGQQLVIGSRRGAEVFEDPLLAAHAPYSFIKLTPAHFSLLPAALDRCPHLTTTILAGGEALHPGHLHQFIEQNIDLTILNEYGPTETTVGCTVWPFHTGGKDFDQVQAQYPGGFPIGVPMKGCTVYILQGTEPCAIGVPGELCIGGMQVGEGYLNLPELTQERFVADPFSPTEGARMYRSGDKARWLEDGTLHYLGRMDGQVKIRGYRIEPGEIETALQQLDGISQAVVVAGDDGSGGKQLVAYVVTEQFDRPGIVARLKERLPDYMVPAVIMPIDQLPLTVNGKVDKRALPQPDGPGLDGAAEYVAPRTGTEQKLAVVWSEILNRETVGIKDDFFAIGGHSLKATRLASHIHREFDVKVELKDLFNHTVLEDQARFIDGARTTAFQYIPLVPEQDGYALSSSQRRLWVLSQFEDVNVAYNVSRVLVFEGQLDDEALGYAFDTLIDRHESLRTVFRQDSQDRVLQHVQSAADAGFSVARHDLRGSVEQEEAVMQIIQAGLVQPFDLANGPLLRAITCRVEDHKWVFCYVLHHIVSDGWTLDLIIKELLALYNARVNGEAHTLSPLRIQYKDFAAWQQEQLSGAALEAHKNYWLDQFAGELPVLELPLDRARPAVRTYNGSFISHTISTSVSQGMKALAQAEGSTLYMALLAAVQALLHRYTGQEDMVIGAPIANREHMDLYDQVGFYVNTLALRTQFSGGNDFRTLLREVKSVMLGAYEHQVYPFDELVDGLNLQRDRSRNPLFDVQVILHNTASPNQEPQTISGITVSDFVGGDNPHSVFDLVFGFAEAGDELHLSVEYNTDLFDRQTMLRMAAHIEGAMAAIIQNPAATIATLDYTGKEEKEQLLHGFNGIVIPYPAGATLVSLFDEQAAATPDAPATWFDGRSLSYAELQEQSNRLAHYLRTDYGVKKGDFVGLMLDRSDKLIIAMLAVMKAGAAYVPIDPAHPTARKQFVLQDTAAPVLITQTDYLFEVDYFAGHLFAIDVQLDTLEASGADVDAGLLPSDLAYCIYTSGSTGQPKGVLIEQGSIVNTILAQCDVLDAQTGEHHLQFASPSFDASVSEIFVALASGATLYIINEADKKIPARLEEYLSAHGINLATIPPAYLALLDMERIGKVDKLITAGEAAIRDRVLLYLEGGGRYYNAYGPTEASICATMFPVAAGTTELRDPVPIGRPIANAEVLVLDRQNGLAPIGVPGEICLGGPGLARGYLNRPELTGEKFIAHPFRAGARLYRTGDLGRWLADGTIEYLGRVDDQVKVRGHRIELGEIESVLQGMEGVSAAAVVARTDRHGEKQLVAYVVLADASLATVRNGLAGLLPVYMVPDHFVPLETLPLTTSGKVNKKALPEPGALVNETSVYVAPRTATEEKLALVWQDILGRERVGATDHFFDLGGNSLKVIRLVSQVHKVFAVKAEMKDLFARLVLEEQAAWIAQATATVFAPIPVIEEDENYILSSAQHRLWILSQFGDGNVAYNLPSAFVFEGVLDVAALRGSFDDLVERHEILRTVFRANDEKEVRQLVLPIAENKFRIAVEDLSSHANGEAEALRLIAAAAVQPFDLAEGPLLRASLYQVEADRWLFSYVMHHIISDGWSMGILMKELMHLYNSRTNGEAHTLKPLRIQYKDYAAWQQGQLRDEAAEGHKAYWLEQFAGELPVLSLVGDKPRPAVKTYNGATIVRRVKAPLAQALRGLGQEEGSTLFMALVAAVNGLLYRYTGQEDLVVGTQVAGRDHPDLEDQIGMYLNTLALRTRFSGAGSFRSLLREVKETTLAAYGHQAYPFDELVDALNLHRDLSRNPLFDVSVVLQAEGAATVEGDGALVVKTYEDVENGMSKFDLAFDFAENGEELQAALVYNTDIYGTGTAEGLMTHLMQWLEAVTVQSDVAIAQVNYLSVEEQDQLLNEFNDTKVAYPSESIASLFEAQVLATPNKKALVFGDRQLTYKELNEQANKLAAYLRSEHHIRPDDKVAIMLDRSEALLVAILGVLKSGAAYVPMDVDYPAARKQFILNDTQAQVLITQSDYLFELDYFSGSLFAIDVQLEGLEEAKNVENISKPTDLAYVMYTSGSTGSPKGVLIEQRSVVRLVKSSTWLSFSGEEVILSTGAVSFDATTFEYWAALLNGGTLVLCSKETLLDEQKLAEQILSNHVDTMWFTSGWLNQLVDKDISVFHGLKTIVAGGDKLSPQHIRSLRSAYPDVQIINGYGPTENTTFSLTYTIGNATEPILIGKPITNSTAYILDAQGGLCPIGVVGEICVGGDGLARGYLNNEELTEQKFIHHSTLGRLYKTGDLGRWLADGNIEFLGRKDSQVKVRGYRIEPGEIENALQARAQVEAAVVVIRGDEAGEKQIVAYVVSPETLVASDLRAFLSQQLPSYMLPDRFMQLEALPLTANGKVDRKALPDEPGMDSGAEYVAPRTETEHRLAAIWSEILNRSTVSATDNFFEIGGHSLKATRLASQIHREFNVKMELRDIFTKTVLEEQAQLIDSARKDLFVSIQPVEQADDYVVSSSQRRLWILSQLDEGNVAYNIPGAYIFEGHLHQDALAQAFDSLIGRHEILRTVFREESNGAARQLVQAPGNSGFRLRYQDLRANGSTSVEDLLQADFMQPFDLVNGPLLRATLYQLADDRWVIGYVMHHIISDGWSMDILIRELLTFYNSFANGEAHTLSPLRIQYKDYAAWQRAQLQGESLEAHRAYWLQQFEGELPLLELPTDRTRPAIKSYNGGVLSGNIGAGTLAGLNRISQEEGSTLFMTVLAAVNTLLYKYSGQEDIIVGSPIAGRVHAELEDQIGFYVNTLALRLRFSGAQTFRELVQNSRTVTLGAYEHQVFPFDELVDALQLQRDMSRNPLFDVSVVLHNGGDSGEGRQLGEMQSGTYDSGASRISKFDLLFGFVETASGLNYTLEYNSDIFREESVQRLSGHLLQLMDALVALPAQPIGQLDYLAEEEKDQLVHGFNDGATNYPREATLVSLFEDQTARTPDGVAVVCEGASLTYQQLNEQANQLAHYLRQNYTVQNDSLIGIKLERSPEMIVAIIAILKAGGAYVPIDPSYPQERIDYMIEDSNCLALIDEEELNTFYSKKDQYSTVNPERINKASDLAYVIYTSGTTGKPKGSLIEHRNVVRLLVNDAPLFDFNERDVWTMFHSYCFDFSVWEMYGALLFGGKLVMIPSLTAKDPSAFREVLKSEGVTVFNQTPSAFYNLIKEELGHGDSSLQLRYVIFGGEALSPGKLAGWHQKYPQTQLINMYGITETTVHVTYKQIGEQEIAANSASIGRPIPTLSCYVLDAYGQLAPIGVAGELYVGGEGVCRGYLNRAELTAKKFIDSPFKQGERLYRSGDKARLLPNGELEYGGRIDDQVKIRGYRIELGEVESALRRSEKIEDVVLLARRDEAGEMSLVAYLTAKEELNVTELRLELAAQLPAYMLPAHYVQLDHFPLTSNGKVDKKALPEPGAFTGSTTTYVAPTTEIETALATTYEEVLRRQPIGTREDFFMLGGDSIKSIQIVSRMKQKGYALTIRDILLYPVIEDLARQVKTLARIADQQIVEGFIPLSPIQHEFFEADAEHAHHFNQSVLLTSRVPVNEEALKTALHHIVLHHDALRMVYHHTDGVWMQENLGAGQSYGFERIEEADEQTIAAHCDRIQASFDLATGPLFKAILFRNEGRADRLLLVAHHLLIDGVSWRILFEDLSTLYQQSIAGEKPLLPLKTDSFRHWQGQQLEYATGADLQKEAKYWSNIEAQAIEFLPLDNPEGANRTGDTASAVFTLDEAATERLLTQCYKAYHTEINDLLLTGLSMALSQVFGLGKVLVRLEGHGREQIGKDVDVTRTIGWFTTTYPVVFDMRHHADLTRQLIEVKESLHRVPNKGIGYGMLRYLAGSDYRLSPEITFNYLGDFGSGVASSAGTGLFEYGGDYKGKELSDERPRNTVLDVSGLVAGGQLRIAITYSREQYKAATIELVATAYRNQLQTLIDRLSAEEETHLSPVDFTYKGLSVEQLQKLNQIV